MGPKRAWAWGLSFVVVVSVGIGLYMSLVANATPEDIARKMADSITRQDGEALVEAVSDAELKALGDFARDMGPSISTGVPTVISRLHSSGRTKCDQGSDCTVDIRSFGAP